VRAHSGLYVKRTITHTFTSIESPDVDGRAEGARPLPLPRVPVAVRIRTSIDRSVQRIHTPNPAQPRPASCGSSGSSILHIHTNDQPVDHRQMHIHTQLNTPPPPFLCTYTWQKGLASAPHCRQAQGARPPSRGRDGRPGRRGKRGMMRPCSCIHHRLCVCMCVCV
jgi:hypothetical protein